MWGQIAGAVLGGIMGNKRAREDRKAMDRANAANMAGFNQYKPYVDAGLSGGQDAFNDVLNTGYYQGQTLADTNPYASTAANTMGGFAPSVMSSGFGLMNTGGAFGQNFSDLYNQAQQDSLSGAIDYANQNAGALTDALMSDARRNTQLAMQGNNMDASGTGNVNSSRAGIADAALNSELARQTAATGATVRNNLIDRKMNADAAAFGRSMERQPGPSRHLRCRFECYGYWGRLWYGRRSLPAGRRAKPSERRQSAFRWQPRLRLQHVQRLHERHVGSCAYY